MDHAARIRHIFETLQERLPGYLFPLLEVLTLRQLQGDGVYLELEALLEGLHEHGVLDDQAFDSARALLETLPLGGALTPQENRHD